MNFDALQMLVKSLLKNFKCVLCHSAIKSKDINLLSINGNNVNLDIKCPKCGKSSFIKSEVVSVDLSAVGIKDEDLMAIKGAISSKNAEKIKKSRLINDTFIVDLDKNLKKENVSATDLFEGA